MMDSFGSAAMRQEFQKLNDRLDALEKKIDALRAPSPASSPATALPASPASPTFSVPEGVLQLLNMGQKQQAIEAYQQLAGVDARTAEAVIASLAAAKSNPAPGADKK